MKKKCLALMLLFICFFLAGCRQIKREEVSNYRAKQLISSLFTNFNKTFPKDKSDNNDTKYDETKLERTTAIIAAQELSKDDLEKSPNSMRALAYAWGEGDLKYHILLPGDRDRFLCSTFSATTNTTYNVSYIVNLPAKLVANIRTDLSIKHLSKDDFNGDKFQTMLLKSITNVTVFTYILYDIFYAAIGFLLSCIMIIVGFFIGLITSPLQTFYDIIPSLLGFIKTFIYAIINLFY